VDNREQGSALRLLGAQYARLLNCNFVNSGQGGRSVEFREFRWDDILVDNCNFYQSGKVDTYYNKALGKQIFEIKPEFINIKNFNFNLKEGSALSSKAVGGVGASL
jgi:poly(beta-D-mannuronate) lyase